MIRLEEVNGKKYMGAIEAFCGGFSAGVCG